MHLEMSSAKCRPLCLGLSVLKVKEHGLISSKDFYPYVDLR